jgi:hypothetical protein
MFQDDADRAVRQSPTATHADDVRWAVGTQKSKGRRLTEALGSHSGVRVSLLLVLPDILDDQSTTARPGREKPHDAERTATNFLAAFEEDSRSHFSRQDLIITPRRFWRNCRPRQSCAVI